YTPGDLLNPPPSWRGAFDLLAEIYTVQPLHRTARTTALSMLPRLAAPGGTRLVIAPTTPRAAPERCPAHLPWPPTRPRISPARPTVRPPLPHHPRRPLAAAPNQAEKLERLPARPGAIHDPRIRGLTGGVGQHRNRLSPYGASGSQRRRVRGSWRLSGAVHGR